MSQTALPDSVHGSAKDPSLTLPPPVDADHVPPSISASRTTGVPMSLHTATEVSPPFLLANGGFLSQPWVGHTARLASRRLKSSVAVISAHGDLDASNVSDVTEYTLGHVTGCRGLILDLRGLNFFATEGFPALHRVAVCCARAGIGWAVVPGAAVSRVLAICDPQALLPAAETVDAALATVHNQLHPPQPLITSRGAAGRCGRAVCVVCGGTSGSDTSIRG
jgi:anti-anti-sigma factor